MNKKFPPHLAYAMLEVGTLEYPGLPSNKEVEKYFLNVQLSIEKTDDVPWCASFVNWCLHKAGLVGTRSALARSYQNWSEELSTPELGCIAVYKRGNKSWQGHVNFYLDKRGGLVTGVGGNTNNRVGVERRFEKDVITYRKVPVVKKFHDCF